MKKAIQMLGLLSVVGAGFTGCSYGAIASTPQGQVIIARQDNALFGALRKIYVCTVNGTTLTCNGGESSP